MRKHRIARMLTLTVCIMMVMAAMVTMSVFADEEKDCTIVYHVNSDTRGFYDPETKTYTKDTFTAKYKSELPEVGYREEAKEAYYNYDDGFENVGFSRTADGNVTIRGKLGNSERDDDNVNWDDLTVNDGETIDLYLIWRKTKYVVTYDVAPDGAYAQHVNALPSGEEVTIYQNRTVETIDITGSKTCYPYSGWDVYPNALTNGFAFEGWYYDKDLTKRVSNKINISADMYFYAKYTYDYDNLEITGVEDKVYNGKKLTQNPKITADVELKKGKDYTISYKDNKNVGEATMTITGKGKYEGSRDYTFNILPKGTSITKVTPAKKSLKVTWKKQTGKMSKARITGYQIQVSKNKKFKSGNKTVTVKGYNKSAGTVKKLTAKKKYFVRIRTYTKSNGKTFYSKWSKVKTAKVK